VLAFISKSRIAVLRKVETRMLFIIPEVSSETVWKPISLIR
jgi:hypothetical protein